MGLPVVQGCWEEAGSRGWVKGCGLRAGPLCCWRCLPVVVCGLEDWPLLPAAAESFFPALGSVPGIGPILEGLLGCPGPEPGLASPGRCPHWAPGLAAGLGLPAQRHAQVQHPPAEQNPHLPIHVPTKAKQVGGGGKR